MAKTEQKYVVDKETVEHLVVMLRDGVRGGATDGELREQTWEILDPQYRSKTDQAFREMKEGKVKRFKNADRVIEDLESRRAILSWAPAYAPMLEEITRTYAFRTSEGSTRRSGILSIPTTPHALGGPSTANGRVPTGTTSDEQPGYSIRSTQARVVIFLRSGPHSIY